LILLAGSSESPVDVEASDVLDNDGQLALLQANLRQEQSHDMLPSKTCAQCLLLRIADLDILSHRFQPTMQASGHKIHSILRTWHAHYNAQALTRKHDQARNTSNKLNHKRIQEKFRCTITSSKAMSMPKEWQSMA
jgi:hypothetical protein